MAELLLNVALFDLGRRGEAGAQRVPREFLGAILFRRIGPNTGRERDLFDKPRHLTIGEAIRANFLAFAADTAEKGPMMDPGELQPGLQSRDRAGGLSGAASDLDLAPAGFTAQRDEQALGQDLDPAGPIDGLIAAAVEPGDLGTPETTGKAQKQHGAVAHAPQRTLIEHRQHAHEIVWQNRFLLPGRAAMRLTDAGQHRRDMPVSAVEDEIALTKLPDEGREPPLDRRDRIRGIAAGARRTGCNIKSNDLRIGRGDVEPVAAAPGLIMAPVSLIGPARIFGARGLGVIAGALGELLQGRGGIVGRKIRQVSGGQGLFQARSKPLQSPI